jgi:hypothetical protein
MKFFLLSALFFSAPFMLVTAGDDLDIDWRKLPDAEYIDQEVEGDGAIIFTWVGRQHNVWEFRDKGAFNKCDFEEADSLVDPAYFGALFVEPNG